MHGQRPKRCGVAVLAKSHVAPPAHRLLMSMTVRRMRGRLDSKRIAVYVTSLHVSTLLGSLEVPTSTAKIDPKGVVELMIGFDFCFQEQLRDYNMTFRMFVGGGLVQLECHVERAGVLLTFDPT